MSTQDGASEHENPEQRRPLRIVLADDHQVVRHGLQMVLEAEPDFEVVAQLGDVPSIRRQVLAHRPDVLVLDLNMPGGIVLDAIPELREEAPETQIVVLTMQDDPAVAQKVMHAGARAFVLKEAADSELALAIRRAAEGEPYVNRRLAGRMAAQRIRARGVD
jgi:two-component system response regulator NreC